MSQSISSFHKSVFVMDAHVHPALKTYLWGKRLDRRHWTTGAWWPFGMRVDIPKMKSGGVNAALSVIYAPEKEMLDDCMILKITARMLGGKFRELLKGDSFEITVKMIDDFEAKINSIQKQTDNKSGIPHSKEEFKYMRENKMIALPLAIEGAHSLNGNLENVNYFFNRGIVSLGLAHFYPNKTGPTAGGIPRSKKILGCFKNEASQKGELTPFGKDVVDLMLDLGMIVDLTHVTPESRKQIININNNKRPLMASHVGVQKIYNHPKNLMDQEIKQIAESGGVIGIIFMNYWLKGREPKYGLSFIIQTAKHLKKTGGADCIAIGSDFDGLTDPPDDIKDISKMPVLTEALINEGFNKEEIQKILGLNLLRVIEDGWGK